MRTTSAAFMVCFWQNMVRYSLSLVIKPLDFAVPVEVVNAPGLLVEAEIPAVPQCAVACVDCVEGEFFAAFIGLVPDDLRSLNQEAVTGLAQLVREKEELQIRKAIIRKSRKETVLLHPEIVFAAGK